MSRHEWARGDDSRYGIYLGDPARVVPVTTSREGIGLTLVTLAEDGDLTPDTRVGILDGIEGHWLINPYAVL